MDFSFSEFEKEFSSISEEMEDIENKVVFIEDSYLWLKEIVGTLMSTEEDTGLELEISVEDDEEISEFEKSSCVLAESCTFRIRLAPFVNASCIFFSLDKDQQDLMLVNSINSLIASLKAFVETWSESHSEDKTDEIFSLFGHFLSQSTYENYDGKLEIFTLMGQMLLATVEEFAPLAEEATELAYLLEPTEAFFLMAELLSLVADINMTCNHNFLEGSFAEYNEKFFEKLISNLRSLYLFGEV